MASQLPQEYTAIKGSLSPFGPTFLPGSWVTAKLSSDSAICSILCFHEIEYGCLFGDYLSRTRKGQYVVAGELVQRRQEENSEHADINYDRTHVKVVIKIFSDCHAAAQEAQVFRHARGNPESASRLPQLVGMLEDKKNFYILLEHIEGGDLFNRIHSMKGANVPEPLGLRWMLDLLHCVQGLHRRNIAHMDLSPENILLDRKGRCLLIDFEMSIILPPTYRKGTLYQGIPCCGKESYMSPEVYRRSPKGMDPLPSDIWSLGVIFYVILTGHPVYNKAGDDAFLALERGEFDKLIEHYSSLGCRVPEGWMKEMIRSMLQPVPSLRPSIEQLLETIKYYQDLVPTPPASPLRAAKSC